jgi:hypothetical protein
MKCWISIYYSLQMFGPSLSYYIRNCVTSASAFHRCFVKNKNKIVVNCMHFVSSRNDNLSPPPQPQPLGEEARRLKERPVERIIGQGCLVTEVSGEVCLII